MVAARGGDTAATIALLDAVIDAGMTDVAKVAAAGLRFLKRTPAWERVMGRLREAERRYVSRLSRSALRTELLQMWAEDQRVRSLLRVDRVRRNQQRPQRYSMAIRRESGTASFYPIEDEAQVDERRKAIGLEPLAVHARLKGFEYARLMTPSIVAGQR